MQSLYTFDSLRRLSTLLPACMLMLALALPCHAMPPHELRIPLQTKHPETVAFELVESKGRHSLLQVGFSHLDAVRVQTPQGAFVDMNLLRGHSTGALGTPRLPAEKRLIEIPHGGVPKVKVLSYSVEEFSLPELGLNRPLMPVQPSPRKDTDPAKVVFEHQPSAYAQEGWIAPELASLEVLGHLRGMRLARLTIAPVAYHPQSNRIRVYNNLEIEISYPDADTEKTSRMKAATHSPWFEPLYARIINTSGHKDIYDDHPDLTRIPVGMLVVSHPMFRESLQPFIRWQVEKGFYVKEVYTDEIGDSPADIQAFIHGQYHAGTPERPAPTFLVLVGDHEHLPASATGSASRQVTDLYYASVDGDKFPDMYYGRLSARNPEELTAQIDKILYYQQYLFEDPSYLNEVTLIAGHDTYWNPRVGQPTIHYAVNEYFNQDRGFTQVNAYFDQYTGVYDPERISVAMINYTAHCHATSWGNPRLTVSDIHRMENTGQYPLAIGNCCMSAQFSHDESIAEAWVRAEGKGAVAYIGSAPNTYWFEDFYWAVGAFPLVNDNASRHVPSFEETTLGAYDAPFVSDYLAVSALKFVGNLAVTEAHIQNYPPHSSPLYYWQAYHTFGDPSTVIYLTEGSGNDVSHPGVIPLGQNRVRIGALPGSYVGISSGGVLHGAALVGQSGEVEVEITPFLEAGEARIVVSKPQHIPYIVDLMLASLDGPFVSLKGFEINDELGNQNGLADYGEEISVHLTLMNVGSKAVGQVSVSLEGDDDFIQLLNPGDTLVFDGMGPFEEGDHTATYLNAFHFAIAGNVPDRHQASFGLLMKSGEAKWTSGLAITAHAPVLAPEQLSLVVEAGEQQVLLPGETGTLALRIRNTGHATSPPIDVHLETDNPYLALNQSLVSGIPGLEPGSEAEALFQVTASADTPDDHPVQLFSGITAGEYQFAGEHHFVLAKIPHYLMGKTTEVVSCRGRFFDSGGPDGEYSDHEDFFITFYPEKEDALLVFDFLSFDVEYHSTCNWDRLKIYDGTDDTARQIGGRFCGTDSPGVVRATNPQGALSFHFISDLSVTRQGWEALFHCIDADIPYELRFEVENPDGQALDQAVITLNGQTAPAGTYLFEDIPVGTYSYTVTHTGYRPAEGTVLVDHADTLVKVVVEPDETHSPGVPAPPELLVYPNPAGEQLWLESGEPMTLVRLFDLTGKLVHSRSLNSRQAAISVAELPEGLYLIQVFTPTGTASQRLQIRR